MPQALVYLVLPHRVLHIAGLALLTPGAVQLVDLQVASGSRAHDAC